MEMEPIKKSNPIATLGIILAIIVAIIGIIVGLNVSSNKTSNIAETEETVTLENYEYNKKESTFELIVNNETYDISNYVVNYKNTDVFIIPELLTETMGFSEEEVTSDERKAFGVAETENGVSFPEGIPLIKYINEEHTIIFREGGKLWYCDGEYKSFGTAVGKTTEGTYSLPFSDIMLALGFNGMGMSLDGQTIVLNLY